MQIVVERRAGPVKRVHQTARDAMWTVGVGRAIVWSKTTAPVQRIYVEICIVAKEGMGGIDLWCRMREGVMKYDGFRKVRHCNSWDRYRTSSRCSTSETSCESVRA